MSNFDIYEYIINNYYYLHDIIYNNIDDNNIDQFIFNDEFRIRNKIIPFLYCDVEKALTKWIQSLGFTYIFYDESSYKIDKLKHICGPYFHIKTNNNFEFYIMISKYSKNKTLIDFYNINDDITNEFKELQLSSIKYVNDILLKCVNEELNIDDINSNFTNNKDIITYKVVINFLLHNEDIYNNIKHIYEKYTYNEIKKMIKS